MARGLRRAVNHGVILGLSTTFSVTFTFSVSWCKGHTIFLVFKSLSDMKFPFISKIVFAFLFS